MISGPSGGPYITHWAYMMPYDPDTFTPPSPLPNADLTSTQWAWTVGSRWDFRSDSLFGLGGEGQFTITNYRNGYFWGSGTGPAGSPYKTFTQLGSITPEGNVLFNILDASGSLVSLAGLVVGGARNREDGTAPVRLLQRRTLVRPARRRDGGAGAGGDRACRRRGPRPGPAIQPPEGLTTCQRSTASQRPARILWSCHPRSLSIRIRALLRQPPKTCGRGSRSSKLQQRGRSSSG